MWSYPGAISVTSGPERVERSLVAKLHFLLHLHLDLIQRDVARALDHHLHVVLPGDLGQLSERLQLRELRLIAGVRNRAGPQAVAEREAHVVLLEDLADVLEALVEEVLLVVLHHPLGQNGSAPADDSGDAVGRQRTYCTSTPAWIVM